MQNGHLIEASTLKISAFLKNLICGRGFGSVFRHQYPKSPIFSVGIFFARSPSVGAVSGPGLANVLEAISFVGEGLKVWLEHAGDQAQ